MMDELIERLVRHMAKAEGWEIGDIKRVDPDNPRLRKWVAIAQSCLQEIDTFLSEEEISFEDLEISARYSFPSVSEVEEDKTPV